MHRPLSRVLSWPPCDTQEWLQALVDRYIHEPERALLLFQAMGAWLAFLYQRSGGSLPFVVAAHCTFNALVTLLRGAQMTSTLPF